ncbi:MAG: hypothetical protein QOD67_4345, partial [Caballeronia sp.]|nr:hypothetical protein [Caballeronia sp.]
MASRPNGEIPFESLLQRRVGLPLRGHSRYVGEPEPEQLY